MRKKNSLKNVSVLLNLFLHPRVMGLRVKSATMFAMRKNAILILGFFVLSMPCLTAQNTGYMGKRVLVNMGAEFSPAWIKPVSKPNFQNKYLSFNCILSPSIEIIAFKKGIAGIAYHYLNTKYNRSSAEGFIVDREESENVYNIVEKLTTHGLGIFYKQYLGGENGRAPIGPYIKCQFDGFFFKCPTSSENITPMSDKLFAMKIEFGNDFLLFNRLHLSTGLSLGVPFSGYKGLSYDSDNMLFEIFSWNSVGYEPPKEYARSRIFGAYWIGFTVSVGFLAF